MSFDAHKNFAYSTVATAPSPASSGTSLVVQSGDGAKFPAVPFNATVWPAGVTPTTTNAEIIRVTNISTDTLTITRTQESTSARSIVVGDQLAATITAKTITDIETSGLGSGILQVSQVSRTAGDLTTTGTSFADVTGLTTTITTGANRCLVIFSGTGHNSTSSDNTAFDLAIDGTRQGQTYGLVCLQAAGSTIPNIPCGFSYITSALAAGSHTFKIQWRVDAGTGTLFAATTTTPAILTVIEFGTATSATSSSPAGASLYLYNNFV